MQINLEFGAVGTLRCDIRREDDLNPAFISAFSALAGAAIGGMTSFATSWFTQRAQLGNAQRQAERAKLEALYNDFIAEAARLFGHSLTHQTEDITNMMHLYALIGRMRLVSARPVIDAARRIEDTILENYLGPNRTLHEYETLPVWAGSTS